VYPENIEKPQNSLFPGVLRLFPRFDCQKPDYTMDAFKIVSKHSSMFGISVKKLSSG
jgi:hypothetical protein